MRRKINIETDFMALNLKLSIHNEAKECHFNSKIIAKQLKELGYDVKVVTGYYSKPTDRNIKHSWIIHEDKILETDCRQLREECDIMPDELWAILDKNKIGHRYKEYDFEDIIKNENMASGGFEPPTPR